MIIVFAKAPVPGYAKTRLAKDIGDDRAAELASQMLQAAIEQAVLADCGPVELCCTPDTSHPQFQQLRERYGVMLTQQGQGDLGARMQSALARVLHNRPWAILTGTDAPNLDADYLREAARVLDLQGRRHPHAVFAPTHDGGYAMIGVNRDLPQLFADMPWSTPEVMPQSRLRLANSRIDCTELAMLHDIDEVDDLIYVPLAWMK